MRSTVFVSGAVAILAVASIAAAETTPTLPPNFVLPHGQHDVRKATAGTYTSDVMHTSIIARVSHLGFSMSAFRFGKSSATLQWDPAHIDASKLNATVDPASIATPVQGFAEQLVGKDYLNTAKYPAATFVSTAFHAKDFQHGTVDGRLTIMGKTLPATFDVDLVGAGPGFA